MPDVPLKPRDPGRGTNDVQVAPPLKTDHYVRVRPRGGGWGDHDVQVYAGTKLDALAPAVGGTGGNYTWQFECGMSHVRTDNLRAMTGGGRFGIGFGDGSVINARIVSVYDVSDAVGRWEARITIPQLAVVEFDDDAIWYDGLRIRVEAEGAELEAECGGAWEFNATNLACYYNIDGGGDVELYNSGGAVTLSGTDYDPRENVMQGVPIHWLGTEDVQEEILPDFPGDWDSATYQVEGGFVFGWHYDATDPDASIDESFSPPSVECDDCEYALADITLDTPPTTWDVTITSGMRYYVLRTDEGIWDYYCDLNNLGLGTPGEIQIDKVVWEYRNSPTTLDLNAEDEGLLVSVREAGARCFQDTYDPEEPYTLTGPTTVTDSVTYMAYRKEIVNLEAYGYFGEILSLASCPPLSEGEVRDPGHLGPSGEAFCYYQAYASFLHDAIDCATCVSFISADVGLDRSHIIACLDADSKVRVELQDHALNVLHSTNTEIVAEQLHIKIDRQSNPQRVRLWTVESGTIKVRTSTDMGRTFGSPTTIAMGTNLSADIGLDGTEFTYWLDGAAIKGERRDRANNALESSFTVVASGADATGFAVTVFPKGQGENRVIIRYFASGTRTTITSKDGITFS